MVTISVRRLHEDLVNRLKQRASLNNRSREGGVRHIPQCTAEDDMAARRVAFLAAAERLRRLTECRTHTLAELLIRENRDQGYRDNA